MTVSTISSESITVFANASDLPSRNGSQYSKAGEPKIAHDPSPSDLAFKKNRINTSDSISSLGFDEEVPAPLQDPVDTPQKGHVDQAVVTRQQISRQGSFRNLWRPRSVDRKEHSLFESFPRPPSKVLLHIAGVFPERPEHKQPVHVDKSLPPPPYHVFGRGKKKRILYMVAIVGVLSPLSTFIYFPALGDISRVSSSRKRLQLSLHCQEFHLDGTFILLTITVHMAVHGITPLIWMPLCDYFGRRPILIAALAIFVSANAGLLFSTSFLGLMLLRGAQAFGSVHLTTIGEIP